MVYYRKYRPQRIDDLDNASVRKALVSVLAKEPPHAFLFTGPKGLGKTSSARIVAKVVNCLGREGVEPCNVCEQCLSITEGGNLDVFEIDAASNRGIDEIRDLKEKIRLAPISAKKKVYIIDEVHMLTTEAFNALLKTLEEPPGHALFILCTTDPQKIPSTILSRCFHIAFSLATAQELVRSFQRIVMGEKLVVDDDALLLLADLADGGFRDGAKLLEEVAGLANGEKITAAIIEERYKVASMQAKGDALLDCLVKRDMKGGLRVVASLVAEGVDLRAFLLQLMEDLHDQLLGMAGIEIDSKPHGQGRQLTIAEIKRLFTVLSRVSAEMKYAVLPQLPLELAIVEVCMQNAATMPAGGSESESPTSPAVDEVQVKEDVSVESLRKQVGDMHKRRVLYGETAVASPAKSSVVVESDINLMDVPAAGAMTKEWLAALWRGIIAEMKQYNHTVAGVLRSCQLGSYDTALLVITTAYKFHKERLEDARTRAALIKVCKVLTGKDVEVRVELRK